MLYSPVGFSSKFRFKFIQVLFPLSNSTQPTSTSMATSVYTNFIEPLDIQSKLSILDWLERFDTIVLLQPGLIGETNDDTIKTFSKNYLIASLGPQSYSLIKASIAPKTMAVKVSDSLVNGAFGAIGDNGDNKWRQWMLHCRQWRFGEWRQW